MVRFVHLMENDRYDGELRVGCVCAGHTEQDLEGARRSEVSCKSDRSRRSRWLSRTWRTSAGGTIFSTPAMASTSWSIGVPACGLRVSNITHAAKGAISPRRTDVRQDQWCDGTIRL